jgi:FKBP-type peptidyl-prolyl cis-trans isomerase FkpA
MIKQISTIAITGAVLLNIAACNKGGSGGFKKTDSGLEYKIIEDKKEGESPKEGDMVKIHLLVHIKDSIALDSKAMNGGQPVEIPVMAPQYKGDWTEGLKFMTPGDSAEFLIPVDTLMKVSRGGLPAWMKKGEKVSFNVKLVSIEKGHKETDEVVLQNYFKQNNLQPQKTASGLYYIIEKEGTGPNVAKGQMVTVNYTGKTMDGKSFDSNVDPQFNHVEPFKFPVGVGQVIAGWDEGIMLLKKGSVAKLFVPSPLAYGAQSPGPGIPPHSILMFDVEVIDIAEGGAPAGMQVQ